jgi:hypothetical protein
LDQSIVDETVMTMIYSLCFALLASWFFGHVHSHSLGFHGLDGEPPNSPVLPEILGPFEIEISFIFRAFSGNGLWYQRLIEYSNKDGADLVGIGQLTDSARLRLEVLTPTASYEVETTTAVVVGQVTTVLAGVNATGHLWITLNGQLFVGSVAMSVGELANLNKVRRFKLLGSATLADDSPLDGAVLGLRITPAGGPRIGIEQNRFRNLPAQALGPFTVSFWARFDNPHARANQIVFDFGNGPATNNIYMGSFGQSSRTTMAFGIFQDGTWTRVTLPNSIVPNEVALWHAGVQSNGNMWIQKKNGTVATSQQITNTAVAAYRGVWRNEIRIQQRFGSPPSSASGDILDGFVLGFQLDTYGTS